MSRAKPKRLYPYGSIGSARAYPSWIRNLKNKNGVYAIRGRQDRRLRYIGESHSARLYQTLTRHFQSWSDAFNTAGPTYDRSAVEVAVLVTPAKHAATLQEELICLAAPVDNRLVCDPTKIDPDDLPSKPDPSYRYDLDQLARDFLQLEVSTINPCAPVRPPTPLPPEPAWIALTKAADQICRPQGMSADACIDLDEAAFAFDEPLTAAEALAALGKSPRTIRQILTDCALFQDFPDVPF